jgi:hypothetical protein
LVHGWMDGWMDGWENTQERTARQSPTHSNPILFQILKLQLKLTLRRPETEYWAQAHALFTSLLRCSFLVLSGASMPMLTPATSLHVPEHLRRKW